MTSTQKALVTCGAILALAACGGGSAPTTGSCDAAVNCSGHGTCAVVAGGIECTCATEYAGASCAACAAGHVDEGVGCVHAKEVTCADQAPANATSTPRNVTITYTTGAGWSTPAACAWSCNTNYSPEGGACINSRTVACNDQAPANATSTPGNVTITYTTAAGWSTPAACAWSCNTNYSPDGGACINSRTVTCNDQAPANATSAPGNVTITYTTAAGWSAPAACAWSCNTGFHRDGAACVADVPVEWCRVNYPASFTAEVGSSTTVYGQVYAATATPGAGQGAGLMGMLCRAAPGLHPPIDVAALTCADATYRGDIDSDDEYRAPFTVDAAGTYEYVYAFSGDGGASWMFCGLDGPVGGAVRAGSATIIEPTGG